MKLVVSLIFIALITGFAYIFASKLFKSKKGKKSNKPLLVSTIILVSLLGLLAYIIYSTSTAPDRWCYQAHQTTSTPPENVDTANDYYEHGNYEYDLGNCNEAVASYTESIKLDNTNPQAYNNRAYTYMRLRKYDLALTDLNKALSLKPDYIQALMNRADIHNYYYAIDRQSAIKDYEKAASLGATQKETSVCGHLFLARHNGWTLGAFLDFPQILKDSCY